MRRLFHNPLFIAGVLIKLVLIAIVSPVPVIDWYIPFFNASFNSLGIDPWQAWMNGGGSAEAFPYGYAMWLFFLPALAICELLGIPLIYGYGLTILAADVLLLLVLRKIWPSKDKMLLAAYWLSPIVIVASYILGYNDLIPVLLLVISLYFLKQTRLLLAGLMCIAAISAKFSMILSLPFFIVYLVHNKALRQYLPIFLKGLLGGAVLLLVPFLFSESGVTMLFSNPEMYKVYQLAFSFQDDKQVYLVPLAYLLILYITWRVRRINFGLFNAILGVSFLLVVLMTQASPGWFVWTIPFLVAYQLSSDRIAAVLIGLFSVLYVISYLLFSETNGLFIGSLGFFSLVESINPVKGHIASLLHTSLVAVGIVLAVRIWRDTISKNDYFRLSRKPFVIGVAGDVGAGKRAYSDAIKGLFGCHSVATLSGDDYRLWDRQKPIWQVMTHSNPFANDLEAFANDLVDLTDGKNIHSKHYNHETGRMSHPSMIKSNDVIIASGLHSLYLPILRGCYSLKVFLDMDEGLRRYLMLKESNSSMNDKEVFKQVMHESERHEEDSKQFIRSQSEYADLVLSLQPIHPQMLDDRGNEHPLRFKLVVSSRQGFNEVSLTRILVGICGLHVDMSTDDRGSTVEFTIEGESSAQDIEMAAKMLCPRIFDFLDIHPIWLDGVMGLMQLVTLSHINQALTKRII